MLCSLLGVALLAAFISVLPSEPPMTAGWAEGVTGVAVTIVVAFDIGVAVTPGAGATAICELFKTLLPNVSWMDLNSVSFKSIVSLLNLPQMGASLVFDLFKAISSTIHSSALYFSPPSRASSYQ